MRKQKHKVELAPEERQTLETLVRKGEHAALKLMRAHILLKADRKGPSWTDAKISEAFGCHEQRVPEASAHFRSDLEALARLKSQIGIGKESTRNTSVWGKKSAKVRRSTSLAPERLRLLRLKRDRSGKDPKTVFSDAFRCQYPAFSLSFVMYSSNHPIARISLSGHSGFRPGLRF